MSTELYANPMVFNRYLSERFSDFDYEATSKLSRFSFADKQGKIYESQVSMHMFEKLNNRFGNFIDIKRSLARRRMYVITYLDDTCLELAKEDKTINKSDNIVFDLDYAKSLYIDGDESASRRALEKYGRVFGVELKRNKKFDNMLKTLVKEMATK